MENELEEFVGVDEEDEELLKLVDKHEESMLKREELWGKQKEGIKRRLLQRIITEEEKECKMKKITTMMTASGDQFNDGRRISHKKFLACATVFSQ